MRTKGRTAHVDRTRRLGWVDRFAVVGLATPGRAHVSGASPARVAGSKPNQAHDDSTERCDAEATRNSSMT